MNKKRARRILLIKLTSLGDLIHALPALSDAREAYPEIQFDWVADENFQELARFHPAVGEIFTTNHRAWRKALTQSATYRAIAKLISTLRSRQYDLIIDGQGNFKSALICWLAGENRAGYDKHSVRERIAHLAYQKQFAVSREAHAIDRLRRLFAAALDYPLPTTPPDFQIQKERLKTPQLDLPSRYLLFIHSASWKTKLWPEEHWIKLIRLTTEAGYHILLPWGSPAERARAERLAIHPQAQLLPRLSLSELGYLLHHSLACVSVDTGLAHLAAALGTPSITLYGATDSGLIGTSGENQIHLHPSLPCSPCQQKSCRFSKGDSPCLAEISPQRVFHKLTQICSARQATVLH